MSIIIPGILKIIPHITRHSHRGILYNKSQNRTSVSFESAQPIHQKIHQTKVQTNRTKLPQENPSDPNHSQHITKGKNTKKTALIVIFKTKIYKRYFQTNLGSRNPNPMKKIGPGPSGGKLRTGPSVKPRKYSNMDIDSD